MTKGPSIPTLEDVARAAGVSTATVSRCLNTPSKVVQATRDRVEAAVEALGYTPNFNARAMAARRTQTIGAVVPTLENAIFARMLQAFQERLQERGYVLLVSSSGYDPDLEAQQIKTMVARGADGVLLIGHARDPQIYDYLNKRDLPVILGWTLDPARAQASVGFDNRAAMRAVAEEVLALGHRDIAVLSGYLQGNDRVAARLEGVRDALEAQGAGVGAGAPALRVVETSYSIDAGGDAFAQLMEGQSPPTAILCVNDVLASGAVMRARALGLQVPGDVSITGFDDMELARLVAPQLTTVHVPHGRMGRMAADALVEMLESGAPASQARLDVEIVRRASLGPPHG